ncbi:unnamed protein product [Prorocentrum cordatum]|uniref:PARP catalytic domain-containing protein n=1 Tax=Prorocentrum cordatum TaxID=2364126 RepID=A0ABN9WBN2_9DINO|nr:unnamed protein product [Polarella glacialis]
MANIAAVALDNSSGDRISIEYSYKHVGSIYSGDGSIGREISRRRQKHAAALRPLGSAVVKHNIEMKDKLKYVYALCGTHLFFQAEAWDRLSAAAATKLNHSLILGYRALWDYCCILSPGPTTLRIYGVLKSCVPWQVNPRQVLNALTSGVLVYLSEQLAEYWRSIARKYPDPPDEPQGYEPVEGSLVLPEGLPDTVLGGFPHMEVAPHAVSIVGAWRFKWGRALLLPKSVDAKDSMIVQRTLGETRPLILSSTCNKAVAICINKPMSYACTVACDLAKNGFIPNRIMVNNILDLEGKCLHWIAQRHRTGVLLASFDVRAVAPYMLHAAIFWTLAAMAILGDVVQAIRAFRQDVWVEVYRRVVSGAGVFCSRGIEQGLPERRPRAARPGAAGPPGEAGAGGPPEAPEHIWLLPLAPRAAATVEVTFPGGGVEWAAALCEGGPEVELRAVLEGQGWEQVRVVPFGAAASSRQDGFQAPGHWLSTRATAAEALPPVGRMVAGTYLRRDLRLRADRLEVVEVQQAARTNRNIQREIASDVKTHQYSPEPLEAAANEAWLFHGTSSAGARAIADEGFAEGAYMEHGRAFGQGLYFTECSSKADFYTKPAQAEVDIPEYAGLCCMLLCRVALGRTLVVDVAGTPDKNSIAADFAKGEYHSVLGDREHLLDSYREFVVPNASQVCLGRDRPPAMWTGLRQPAWASHGRDASASAPRSSGDGFGISVSVEGDGFWRGLVEREERGRQLPAHVMRHVSSDRFREVVFPGEGAHRRPDALARTDAAPPRAASEAGSLARAAAAHEGAARALAASAAAWEAAASRRRSARSARGRAVLWAPRRAGRCHAPGRPRLAATKGRCPHRLGGCPASSRAHDACRGPQ